MCRVLIVDDNGQMREYLKDVVNNWDDRLQPLLAESEQAAVDVLSEIDSLQGAIVDLFLTDEWAPNHPEKGEGLRILRAVRDLFPTCFTILISSKRDSIRPCPELVDFFVSFHHSNRDYRSQLEHALDFALVNAPLATV